MPDVKQSLAGLSQKSQARPPAVNRGAISHTPESLTLEMIKGWLARHQLEACLITSPSAQQSLGVPHSRPDQLTLLTITQKEVTLYKQNYHQADFPEFRGVYGGCTEALIDLLQQNLRGIRKLACEFEEISYALHKKLQDIFPNLTLVDISAYVRALRRQKSSQYQAELHKLSLILGQAMQVMVLKLKPMEKKKAWANALKTTITEKAKLQKIDPHKLEIYIGGLEEQGAPESFTAGQVINLKIEIHHQSYCLVKEQSVIVALPQTQPSPRLTQLQKLHEEATAHLTCDRKTGDIAASLRTLYKVNNIEKPYTAIYGYAHDLFQADRGQPKDMPLQEGGTVMLEPNMVMQLITALPKHENEPELIMQDLILITEEKPITLTPKLQNYAKRIRKKKR